MESNNLTREAPPGSLYHIDIDGVRYVAAGKLAAQSGYCRDYIARLARQHRIAGRKVGRHWFIEEKSFQEFCREQEIEREVRRRVLTIKRRLEWGIAPLPTD